MGSAFKDRVVLVAGSRGKIGESLCGFFLSQDARVVGCSRSKATLEHERFQHFICDISDEKAVVEMFFRLDRARMPLDIMILNAGLNSTSVVALVSKREIDSLVSTNLVGPLILVREALKRMIRNKFGRMIVLSSIRVSKPVKGSGVYGMTKAALEQLTRELPFEVGESDVTINAIEISMFAGGMAERLSTEAREQLLNSLARKRPCTPEDLCNAVEFFARPESSYVTGQILKLGFV